jgi:hypothetical protein
MFVRLEHVPAWIARRAASFFDAPGCDHKLVAGPVSLGVKFFDLLIAAIDGRVCMKAIN